MPLTMHGESARQGSSSTNPMPLTSKGPVYGRQILTVLHGVRYVLFQFFRDNPVSCSDSSSHS